MLCTQKLTLKQKRRPPLQPGRHDGCDVHGVVVVWVQLPPRHRQGPDAHRVDEYLFRPVRRRVGGADAGHARARPGYHQHRRDCGAAGHVVVGGGGGGGGVRRQGGVSASEGGSCTLARGRGGGGGVLGVVRGEMRRGYRGGRVATMATFWYDLLLDIGGSVRGSEGHRIQQDLFHGDTGVTACTFPEGRGRGRVQSALCVSIRVRPSVRVQGQYEYVQGRYESTRYSVLPAAVARLSVEASAPVIPIKLVFHVFPNPHAADPDRNGRPIISPTRPLTPASGPTKRTTLPLTATTALFWSFQPPSSAQSPGKNKRGKKGPERRMQNHHWPIMIRSAYLAVSLRKRGRAGRNPAPVT